jgi:hypothetical protein
MKDNKDYEDNEDYKATLNLLEKAAKIEADEGYKAEARERLLASVARQAEPAKLIRIRPRRLVLRTLAAVAALSLVMTGVGFASTDSLPGDTLYPVKRGIEEVRLQATRDNEAKANLYLEIANKRLGESEKLKSLNRRDKIEATLKLMAGNFAQAKAFANKVPAARRAIILKRMAEKQTQADARKQRIIQKQKERLNRPQGNPGRRGNQSNGNNMAPKAKLEHFKKNNGNSKNK